jgi:hypothetical protein
MCADVLMTDAVQFERDIGDLVVPSNRPVTIWTPAPFSPLEYHTFTFNRRDCGPVHEIHEFEGFALFLWRT